MDSLLISRIVSQLQNLIGFSLQSIYLASEHALVWAYRKDDQRSLLLTDTTPVRAHLTLVNKRPETTLDTPYFLQLFRHHLLNGVLTNVSQINDDRIVRMDYEVCDEVGRMSSFYVIIELMGRATNIILCKADHQIIDALHRVPPSEVTKRTIHPGAFYRLPPSYPLPSFWNFNYDPTLPLANQVSGLNDALLDELEMRLHHGALLDDIRHQIASDDTLYLGKKGSRYYLDVLPLTHIYNDFEQLSVEEAINRYYAQFAVEDERTRYDLQIKSHIKKLEKKLNHKRLNLESDLAQADQRFRYREWGQSLLTYLHEIPEHTVSFTTMIGEIIPLKAEWTVAQNADSYFKKYKKLSKSVTILNEQIKLVDEQLAQLEYVKAACEQADAITLKQWRQELGLIVTPPTKSKQVVKYAPLAYVTKAGTKIYVGRNNLQNEYLTFHIARPHDTFVHVHQLPGSHVCIASDHPSNDELTLACELAAYYSSARHSSKVEVQWCKMMNVKKIPGGAPGLVRLTTYQSALFTPQDYPELREVK